MIIYYHEIIVKYFGAVNFDWKHKSSEQKMTLGGCCFFNPPLYPAETAFVWSLLSHPNHSPDCAVITPAQGSSSWHVALPSDACIFPPFSPSFHFPKAGPPVTLNDGCPDVDLSVREKKSEINDRHCCPTDLITVTFDANPLFSCVRSLQVKPTSKLLLIVDFDSVHTGRLQAGD